MHQDYAARVKQILKDVHYASVATATKTGQPWNSPVSYICSKTGEIYWFSCKDSTHSRNIRENSEVFIAIFDSQAAEGQGRGLYIAATARELSSPEEVRIARSYVAEAIRLTPDDFLHDSLRRAYKAVPTQLWTNAAERENGILRRDYRISLPLDYLTTEAK